MSALSSSQASSSPVAGSVSHRSPEAIESRIAELIPELTRLIAEVKEDVNTTLSIAQQQQQQHQEVAPSPDADTHPSHATSPSLARALSQEARLHTLVNGYVRLQSVRSQSRQSVGAHGAGLGREEEGLCQGQTPLRTPRNRAESDESQAQGEGNEGNGAHDVSPAPRDPHAQGNASASGGVVLSASARDTQSPPSGARNEASAGHSGSLTFRKGRRLRPSVSDSFSHSLAQHMEQRARQDGEASTRHAVQPARAATPDADNSSAAAAQAASPSSDEDKKRPVALQEVQSSSSASSSCESPTSSASQRSLVSVSPLTAAVISAGGRRGHTGAPSGHRGLAGDKRVVVSVPSFTNLEDSAAASDAHRRPDSEVSPLTSPPFKAPSSVTSPMANAVAAATAPLLAQGDEASGDPQAHEHRETPPTASQLLHGARTRRPKVLSLERAAAHTTALSCGEDAWDDSGRPPALSPFAKSTSGSGAVASPMLPSVRGTANFSPETSGGGGGGPAPVSTVVSAMPSRQTSMASLQVGAPAAVSTASLSSLNLSVSGGGPSLGRTHGTHRRGHSGRRQGASGDATWGPEGRGAGSAAAAALSPTAALSEVDALALLGRLAALRRGSPWRRQHAFQPSALALHANDSACCITEEAAATLPRHSSSSSGAASVSRVRMGVVTDVVAPRIKGFRRKLRAVSARQAMRCKDCLRPLRPQYVSLRHGGLPNFDAARYCAYTGFYFCEQCHRKEQAPIPARLLRQWDATPQPVSALAANFLMVQSTKPLWCVSAVNPALLRQVAPLRAAWALRRQLVALREVGIACSAFRHLFYGEALDTESERTKRTLPNRQNKVNDALNETSTHTWTAATETGATLTSDRAKAYFIPEPMRYYLEDTELWSLGDLIDLHDACPTLHPSSSLLSSGDNTISIDGEDSTARTNLAAALSRAGIGTVEDTAEEPSALHASMLLRTLHTFKRNIVAHVLTCKDCRRRSTDVCRLCCPADTVEAFIASLLEEEENETPEEAQDGDEGGAGATRQTSAASMAFAEADSFLNHIPLAAHRCLVHTFDLLHVWQCPRCGSCYHRTCLADVSSMYTQQLCGVCETLQRAATTTAAATEVDEVESLNTPPTAAAPLPQATEGH